MADLNEWQGIGRLGQDIELRYLGNGDAVVNFSIACDDSYTDKQSGNKIERTEWVRCVAFRNTAEFLANWLLKGNRILVKGKLKTREYEKDGAKHWVTEIHVGPGTQVIDWPPRDNQQQAPRQQQQRQQQAPRQQQQQQRQGHGQSQQRQGNQQQQQHNQQQQAHDQFQDDDIPFN